MELSQRGGERDLATLLGSLRPVIRAEPYVFCLVHSLNTALMEAAFAIVREDEGITVILPQSAAHAHGLASAPGWACITLLVHSSLEAVGMIAAISTRLAQAGISTNPVAGYYHDHLFVQWEAREQALALIQQPYTTPDPW